MESGLKEPVFRSRKDKYRSKGSRKRAVRARKNREFKHDLRDWLLTTIIAFALMAGFNIYVFNLSTVKGHSMQPTLHEGERIVINKIGLAFAAPIRGEIVILRDPSAPGYVSPDYLVKRVVGLPGDTVEVRGHKLYINGELEEEPYTDTEIQDADFPAVMVEEGRYFVMGDNRHAGSSKDSRYFGTVAEEDIVGTASWIWWPIAKASRLR